MMYEPKYDYPPLKKSEQIGWGATTVPRPVISRDCMVTSIYDVEYDDCLSYAKDRWSNEKTGEWGGGVIDNPVFCGLLGEFAFAKCSGYQKVDLSYRKGGDKYDFKINTDTVNVKNSTENSGAHHVRYVGLIKENQLIQDIFVFTHTLDVDDERKTALIALLGWVKKTEILALHEKAKAYNPNGIIYATERDSGGWRNYEFPFSMTHELDTLI